jgi:hypothetical protein
VVPFRRDLTATGGSLRCTGGGNGRRGDNTEEGGAVLRGNGVEDGGRRTDSHSPCPSPAEERERGEEGGFFALEKMMGRETSIIMFKFTTYKYAQAL